MTLPGTRGSNSFFISNAGEARSDSGSELELIEIRHRVEKGGDRHLALLLIQVDF